MENCNALPQYMIAFLLAVALFVWSLRNEGRGVLIARLVSVAAGVVISFPLVGGIVLLASLSIFPTDEENNITNENVKVQIHSRDRKSGSSVDFVVDE